MASHLLTSRKVFLKAQARIFLKRLKETITKNGQRNKRVQKAQEEKIQLTQKKEDMYRQTLQKKARQRQHFQENLTREQEAHVIWLKQEAKLYHQRLKRYASRTELYNSLEQLYDISAQSECPPSISSGA